MGRLIVLRKRDLERKGGRNGGLGGEGEDERMSGMG